MNERAVLFGASRSLLGVFTPSEPPQRGSPLGVVFLNAGLLHRVGPNRVYVLIARQLAAQGIPSLRFDFSGIGDSAPRDDGMPFKHCSVQETRAAIDLLWSSHGIERFALVGLCSGADAAFHVGREDPRVVALGLVNGFGLELPEHAAVYERAAEETHARYYRTRLAHARSWARVLTGKSNFRAIARTITRRIPGFTPWPAEPCPPDAAQAVREGFRALSHRSARVILLLSEGSTALDLFRYALPEGLACESVRIETIAGSDHLFTLRWSQEYLGDTLVRWLLEQLTPAREGGGT